MTKLSLVICLVSITLTGCNNVEKLTYNNLPEALADCSFFSLEGAYGHSMKVARCPNSTTSTEYPNGNATGNAMLRDGGQPGDAPAVLSYHGHSYIRVDVLNQKLISKQPK
ncbi:lipid kinase [Novimethylophilus kurashikiensis]|uniref:Lipid kinase n=1 Tax=Novimethylophilus kurashikiensis TaxID=1825523 RepID=A0A2R5FAP3_9PROT|nr:hypothetical protein [Novimethylophilus kurashikiensis]GBG14889.1 lipid kinase [Novimethylophilus kurashikiensis]